MAKGSAIAFGIVVVILLIVAALGFYEYSVANSNYSSAESSLSALSSSSAALESSYSQLSHNYTVLEQMYSSLMQKTVTSTVTTTQTTTSTQTVTATQTITATQTATSTSVPITISPSEGGALAAVMEFYDGIAIECHSDVLPFLAPNFTATITGTPFPGTYNYMTFNSTWLSQFFGNYETVYFYTTALPTITMISNGTYQVTDVVQYFVAPTNDPVYLQVFNASNTITVQDINGKLLITQLMWKGNEVPPSTVIVGYPSQHQLQANQILEEYLWEVNSLGAEFPGNVTAKYFSPNAVLQINGVLPPALKNGTYSGIANIENFFNQWDNNFIFVLDYLQDLTPSGAAIPPTVQVNLSPNGANATLVVNDTVLFGFLNQGVPGFPAIYDMHVSVTTYLVYNSTVMQWEIENQTWNVQEVPIPSDTVYYPLGPATFHVVTEDTVTVNASQGAVLQAGNIITVIKPGTYAYNMKLNKTFSVYNFSLIIFSMTGVYAPENTNLTPLYAFAFAINGQITPIWSLVTNAMKPNPAYTIVLGGNPYWTSWTWFGGTFNGTTYVGGSYKFADTWVYGQDVMANVQFFKPVLWIFESSPTPVGVAPTPVSMQVSPVFGLNPIASYTYEVNAKYGGVIQAGNIITVIKPGSYVVANSTGTPMNLTTYNFSVIFYQLNNIQNYQNGTPVIAFAYAINGYVGPKDYSTQQWITVIMTTSQGAKMYTWLANGYAFMDPILVGNGIVVNLTFFRPVPWILTLPVSTTSTMSSMSSSTLSSTTYSSTVGYWGS
ncbi:hypothetical protein [Stygiolobus caldivivus]|uniref:Uncharacterized protein n=1 Tax=Stygiolobus caldivivus TaxID=2824673 RepID=A0A8D5ZIE3_9CREN|nr:hypothetical protein [Stygiolobus caldivivus]BCU69345.1 hypothetical protein KN1_06420 [Stygiolobus caldivivus]